MTQEDERVKHIMVYLDESGHIHKNSHCRYYAIGGFCCNKGEEQRLGTLYRRANKKIKMKYELPMDSELKARDMDEVQKIILSHF